MSSQKLRFALIGLSGHFGRALTVIAERRELSLTAVAAAHEEENIERLKNNPAFTDDTKVMPTPEALLELDDIDAVIINPPYGMNARYAALSVSRGLPIYLEKPYATTFEDLRHLREAAQQPQAGLIVGMFESRAHPVVATAARLVAEGAIGEVAVAYGQKTYKFNEPRRPRWYMDRSLYGGTIPWVAIHAIDWTRFITGLDYKAVFANQIKNKSGELRDVEVAGGIHFELDSGGSALLSFDFLRPLGAPTHGDDQFRIMGTQGELWGILNTGQLTLVDASGKTDVPLDPTISLFDGFVKALLDEGPMPMTTDDGLTSTEAALWARESAERLERLELPR